MNLPLTLALGKYDHVRELRPQGIELTLLEIPIEEMHFRFTRFREWDASEMSFGKVISILSGERPDIVALPVFTSRVFRHSAIYLREDSKIKRPRDLEGRRVGIPEWAQTAGIYVRGMLQHEYGVDLSAIDWYQAGVREPGRVEKVALKLPGKTRITPVADRSLTQMLAAGDLDAAITARPVPGRRLFPDFEELERRYFEKTRIFPVMHLMVVKREVYERNRWVAMNLFKAFEEAKRAALSRLGEVTSSHVPLPWMSEHVARWKALAGDDYWPYGIEPNRPTLEAFTQYAFEQGVAQRKMAPEELFAPETRESFKI